MYCLLDLPNKMRLGEALVANIHADAFRIVLVCLALWAFAVWWATSLNGEVAADMAAVFSIIKAAGFTPSLALMARYDIVADHERYSTKPAFCKEPSSIEHASIQQRIVDQFALVHEISATGMIIRVNPMFCAKIGFSEEELLGASWDVICPALSGGRTWMQIHTEIDSAGGRMWVGETRNRTREGADLWLSTTIGTLCDGSGGVTGYQCVSLDVTEVMALRRERIENSKLMQLGQLTATVAHEIRNPLGAIRTAAFVLERKLNGQVEGVDPQLTRINNGIRRCDKIITELLGFSRKKSLKLERLSVDHWLSDVLLEECRTLPVFVQTAFIPGLGNQEAAFDPDQMRQVMINLINNAAEAMSEKIANSGQETGYVPQLTVSTFQNGEFAEISVSDNGPGIEEANLKRIREPLFTTKSFGVGLGIPAIERILQNHGGELLIRSTSGQGTVMTARFRFTPAEAYAQVL